MKLCPFLLAAAFVSGRAKGAGLCRGEECELWQQGTLGCGLKHEPQPWTCVVPHDPAVYEEGDPVSGNWPDPPAYGSTAGEWPDGE